MVNIINKDIVKSIDAADLVIGSVMKPVIESVASPIIGNGTLISGGAKLVVAFGATKYAGNNRIGKGLAIGAGMDGAEDIIVALKGKAGLGSTPSTSGGVF